MSDCPGAKIHALRKLREALVNDWTVQVGVSMDLRLSGGS